MKLITSLKSPTKKIKKMFTKKDKKSRGSINSFIIF